MKFDFNTLVVYFMDVAMLRLLVCTSMENTAQKLPVEISNIVERIVESFAPARIILFGSYASGNVTPDSDLDLLVIMETDFPPAERQRQVSRLLRPRRFPMDIIVKNPAEIQKSMRRVILS